MKRTIFLIALFAGNASFAAVPIDGCYSTAFGGLSYLFPNENIRLGGHALNAAAYHWGYNAGGSLGYQSNPLRYEGEVSYIAAKVKHYDQDAIRQSQAGGNASLLSAMANVYYDFPDLVPAVSPFLGLGIGYAYTSVSLDNAGIYPSSIKTTVNTFAYQGTAGLTYNYLDNYSLSVAYRFVSTPKLNELGKPFQANLAMFAATYRFDGLRYH